jgi:hypothetical protein
VIGMRGVLDDAELRALGANATLGDWQELNVNLLNALIGDNTPGQSPESTETV